MQKKLFIITLLSFFIGQRFVFAQNESLRNDNSQIFKSEKNNLIRKSELLRFQAKKMIVDSLPGEQKMAEQMLLNSIRLSPYYIDAYLDLAKLIQIQIAQGSRSPQEIERSLNLMQQAYDLSPTRPASLFARVDTLRYLGQQSSAEELYHATLNKYPDDKDTLIEKVNYLHERKPEEAIQAAEQALQKGATIDDFSQYIGSALVQAAVNAGKNPEEFLVKFTTKYPDRWLWHKVALSYLNRNRFDKATEAFEKAISLGNTVESRLQLGIMQYNKEKKYNLAIQNINALLLSMHEKRALKTSAFSLVYAHLSLAYFHSRKNSDASRAAFYCAKTSQENKQFYISLVSEYRSLNSMFILGESLEYLIKDEPDYELPYAIFGEVKSKNKDYVAALDLFDEAISLNTKRDDFYAERGSVYYKMNDYKNALIDFEAALSLRPHTAIYIYNKACMLALLGKKQEAMQTLMLAFREDKNLIDLAQVDKDFETIKTDSNFSSQFSALLVNNFD